LGVEVLKLIVGTGADIIFEIGGAQTICKSFNCIEFGRLIDWIGYMSGKTDDADGGRTNVNVLALTRNVTSKGISNGGRDKFEEMFGFYEE
jgi:NADPH:quinone reductase-like Zn-dependent oxidoreductase